ncbi:MAG: DUF6443 domain-containing protein, partial [Prevotellaceae bacterium]|nr:DUF6443 domain-containing protein [Prevotellaceae bacterium]
MKTYIYLSLLFLLFPAATVLAQSNNQNYILTSTCQDASGTNALVQIDYFDDLGRAEETVLKQITPTKKDMISYIQYDAFGRATKNYLPTTVGSSADGAYVGESAFINAAKIFYANDSRPFVETLYEASPLNRVLGQKRAGVAWETHPTKITYTTNNANEVPFYQIVGNKLTCSSKYEANTLYKTISADEDGKTVAEYKDKLGRLIMTVHGADSRTCYVYDDFGRLRYVLPPAPYGFSGTTIPDDNYILKDYCYVYKYDERNNLIYKRLPSCEPIYMVYDKANRLILSQDGNQRLSNHWTMIKYDTFGRILYTCIMSASRTHAQLQGDIVNLIITEVYDPNHQYKLGDTGYSCTYFRGQVVSLLTVNYYDKYDNLLSLLSAGERSALQYATQSGYGVMYSNVTTKLVGSRTYLLDNSGKYLVSVCYYDKRGNIIQNRSTNHLGGYDMVFNRYDFTDKLSNMLKKHSISPTVNTYISEFYTYLYDHAGRLKQTYYMVDNYYILLAENFYDELGHLVIKKRYNGADEETLQYNIQNWLTQKKSGSFEEVLNYSGNYNGNISSKEWTYGSTRNKYTYQYDALNRLTKGTSQTGGFSETFTYDRQGNITQFQRIMGNKIIDNMWYGYLRNQVEYIEDFGQNQNQYLVKENNPTGDIATFQYDANGNMISDTGRKITKIEYNVLNLPNQIFFSNKNRIVNIYAADGRKLESVYL